LYASFFVQIIPAKKNSLQMSSANAGMISALGLGTMIRVLFNRNGGTKLQAKYSSGALALTTDI
jgi:hypothetical protein